MERHPLAQDLCELGVDLLVGEQEPGAGGLWLLLDGLDGPLGDGHEPAQQWGAGGGGGWERVVRLEVLDQVLVHHVPELGRELHEAEGLLIEALELGHGCGEKTAKKETDKGKEKREEIRGG